MKQNSIITICSLEPYGYGKSTVCQMDLYGYGKSGNGKFHSKFQTCVSWCCSIDKRLLNNAKES